MDTPHSDRTVRHAERRQIRTLPTAMRPLKRIARRCLNNAGLVFGSGGTGQRFAGATGGRRLR